MTSVLHPPAGRAENLRVPHPSRFLQRVGSTHAGHKERWLLAPVLGVLSNRDRPAGLFRFRVRKVSDGGSEWCWPGHERYRSVESSAKK